jgi:hypothetical protein
MDSVNVHVFDSKLNDELKFLEDALSIELQEQNKTIEKL